MFCIRFLSFAVLIFCDSCAQETPTTETPPNKSGFDLSIVERADDVVFSLIRNLLSTGHAGAQIALNRIKDEVEKNKRVLGEIGTSLLPPIG